MDIKYQLFCLTLSDSLIEIRMSITPNFWFN